MKLIISFALVLVTNSLLAAEAIIISFKAPLIMEASYQSKVSQILSKGDKIFISNEYLRQESLPEFVETYDRLGQSVFIPSKFIKVIYKDEREKQEPIRFVDTRTGHDSTDYRIEEPIPHTYPYEKREFSRLNVAFELGSNSKDIYSYSPHAVDKQEFSAAPGFRLVYQRKMDFDLIDRLYIGAVTSFSTTSNEIIFKDETVASEDHFALKLGPIVSYDFYKSEKYLLNLGTGFTWNYHQSDVQIQTVSGESENNLFSGFSLSPFMNSIFSVRNVFPNTDFIFGSEIIMQMPHTQSGTAKDEYNAYWSETNPYELSQSLRFIAQIQLGLSFKY